MSADPALGKPVGAIARSGNVVVGQLGTQEAAQCELVSVDNLIGAGDLQHGVGKALDEWAAKGESRGAAGRDGSMCGGGCLRADFKLRHGFLQCGFATEKISRGVNNAIEKFTQCEYRNFGVLRETRKYT